MGKTIQVKSHSIKGDWANLETNEGKVSVALSSCPKLKEAITATQTFPYSLYGNLVKKGDKNYLWDTKDNGTQPPKETERTPAQITPPQSSNNIASACIIGACQLHSGGMPDMNEVIATADRLYEWGKSRNC